MSLLQWNLLPPEMQNESVKYYYMILNKKRSSLFLKRFFDIFFSCCLLIILLPILLPISLLIKLDSKGPIFFRQTRITQYGKNFRIFKFRTMVENAECIGNQITVENDHRITRIGKFLRHYRLDELPQLINILVGEMSFVGTRPEIPKYVAMYNELMWATLLLPAGVTSTASLKYRNEDALLNGQSNSEIDSYYVNNILPVKMKFNLDAIEHFSILTDLKLIICTILIVFLPGMENRIKIDL